MPSIICMHQLTYLEIFHDRVVIPHLLVDPAQVELRLDLDVVGVAKGGALADQVLVHQQLATLSCTRKTFLKGNDDACTFF